MSIVGALLRKYIDEYGIKSGELHLYTPTRWTSMFETTNSIYERHKDLLTNDKVKHILGLRVINNRWESFEIHPYLLVYFLHPLYRGVGLKSTIWPNLTKYAGEIFWNMNKKNHSNNKVAELIGQMANFKCSGVFSIQYSSSYTRPRTWWQVIDDSNEYLNYESKERSEEELRSLVQGRLEIPNEDVYVLIINEMVDLNNPIFNEDYDDLNDNIEVEDESMEESSEEVFDFDAIPEISPPSN
ncbi:13227_t:CDS:2, partial [Entrophospora sp. SA101]